MIFVDTIYYILTAPVYALLFLFVLFKRIFDPHFIPIWDFTGFEKTFFVIIGILLYLIAYLFIFHN